MIISFIEGFLLGMGAAIPLGPINILIMNTALKEYKGAVSIGFGALSADVLYLSLILLGISTVFDDNMLKVLGILGSIFLLYMAYMIYNNRHKVLDTSEKVTSSKGLVKVYLQGFTLTFVNPYTIAFWLSIAGYTVQKELDPFITITGLFCAILLWITVMPYVIHRSKHKISQRLLYVLNLFSSVLLLGFGLLLFLTVFTG